MKYPAACAECKYSLLCINQDCKYCEMRDKELDVCKCTTVVVGQDCPYYELIEEE